MKSLQGFPPGGGLASLIKTLTNPSFLIGYSKKTGPLRKFKSETPDKSDSEVEKYIKNLYF